MSIRQIFQNEIEQNYKNIFINNVQFLDDYNIALISKEILINSKINILEFIRILINNNHKFHKNNSDYYIQIDVKELQKNGCLFSKDDINDIFIEHLDFINKDLNTVLHTYLK
jgi:hypothetical protein